MIVSIVAMSLNTNFIDNPNQVTLMTLALASGDRDSECTAVKDCRGFGDSNQIQCQGAPPCFTGENYVTCGGETKYCIEVIALNN